METLKNWPSLNTEDTFEQLYADNFPWLQNYVQRNSGNESDAKDIFQESITAAWINVKEGRFTGDSVQFNAYLRQICKYKWINQIRSSDKRKLVYDDALVDMAFGVNGHELLEKQLEQSRLLQSCLMQLGLKCRQVLRMFYYQRKPLGEIAADMQNTEESIKTIKYRCMMQLRKLFLEKNKRDGGL